MLRPSPKPLRHPAIRRRSLPLLAWAALLPLLAGGEARAAKADSRELKREMAEAAGLKREKDFDPKGGKAKPDDATARGLARLRELMEITDDAEWDIIGERINRVVEARNTLGKGGPPGRGSPMPMEKSKKAPKPGSTHPEQEALRLAVRDNLPDAEIKARLDRAHEVMQQLEAKLAKAQEELRAVLTVRQEAVAVLAGLLPP